MKIYMGTEPPFAVRVVDVGSSYDLPATRGAFGWGYGLSGGSRALAAALTVDALQIDATEGFIEWLAGDVVASLPRPSFELPETEVGSAWERYRTLPEFSAEAEAAVLGMLLRGAPLPPLETADFARAPLARVYERIVERRAAGVPATQHELQLDALDGLLGDLHHDALWAWHDSAPAAPPIDWWASEVRRAALRRRGWRPTP
jgi:hypothetical protein